MPDIFDELLGQGVDPRQLAAQLRGQAARAQLAQLSGVPQLQAVGKQMEPQIFANANAVVGRKEKLTDQALARDAITTQKEAGLTQAKALADQNAQYRTDKMAQDERYRRDALAQANQLAQDKLEAASEKAGAVKAAAKEKDINSYNTVADSLDRMDANVAHVANHPGLAANFGLRGMIYNVPNSEAADAATALNNLKSQLRVDTMLTLKNASRTGSTGFGQLSEKEGTTLETYVANLEKAQSLKSVHEQLDKIHEYVQKSKARLAAVAGIAPQVPATTAAAPQQQDGTPRKVSTPQEAMALPPGTVFVTPDGRVKTR